MLKNKSFWIILFWSVLSYTGSSMYFEYVVSREVDNYVFFSTTLICSLLNLISIQQIVKQVTKLFNL